VGSVDGTNDGGAVSLQQQWWLKRDIRLARGTAEQRLPREQKEQKHEELKGPSEAHSPPPSKGDATLTPKQHWRSIHERATVLFPTAPLDREVGGASRIRFWKQCLAFAGKKLNTQYPRLDGTRILSAGADARDEEAPVLSLMKLRFPLSSGLGMQAARQRPRSADEIEKTQIIQTLEEKSKGDWAAPSPAPWRKPKKSLESSP
jgi:hypothetical protein